jgi:hypothetical protein
MEYIEGAGEPERMETSSTSYEVAELAVRLLERESMDIASDESSLKSRSESATGIDCGGGGMKGDAEKMIVSTGRKGGRMWEQGRMY